MTKQQQKLSATNMRKYKSRIEFFKFYTWIYYNFTRTSRMYYDYSPPIILPLVVMRSLGHNQRTKWGRTFSIITFSPNRLLTICPGNRYRDNNDPFPIYLLLFWTMWRCVSTNIIYSKAYFIRLYLQMIFFIVHVTVP